eukprot:173123-Chlamydomonas_euryale.AAC.1
MVDWYSSYMVNSFGISFVAGTVSMKRCSKARCSAAQLQQTRQASERGDICQPTRLRAWPGRSCASAFSSCRTSARMPCMCARTSAAMCQVKGRGTVWRTAPSFPCSRICRQAARCAAVLPSARRPVWH